MKPAVHFSLLAAFISLSVIHPAAAGVLVVDAAGNGDHLTVQQAVDVAQDLDVILIRPGDYSAAAQAICVVDKGVTILGDTSGTVLLASMKVRDLSSPKNFVLRNVTFDAPEAGAGDTLVFEDNLGHALVEDCVLRGTPGQQGPFGQFAIPASPGATVDTCWSVTFLRCTIEGGVGQDTGVFGGGPQTATGPGGCGLFVDASYVSCYDSEIVGGKGGSDAYSLSGPNPGSAGLDVDRFSCVVLGGCSTTGGAGGDGGLDPAQAAGGTGILVRDAATEVRLAQHVAVAGAGGILDDLSVGLTGVPQATPAGGLITALAGPSRSLSITGPLREFENGTLSLTGQPGELALVYLSADLDYLLLNHGVLFLRIPRVGPINFGTFPASGRIDVPFSFDLAPFAVDSLQLFFQCFVATSNGVRLTSPATFLILDDGF